MKFRQVVNGYPDYTLEALLRFVNIRDRFTSKGEAVQRLLHELLKPGILRKFWDRLPPEGQGAVSLALYNNGLLDLDTLGARFDNPPPSFRHSYRQQDIYFDLFFFGQLNLPEEYGPVLSEWVEPLPPYIMPAHDALPAIRDGRKLIPLEHLNPERVTWPDWAAALRFISTGKVRVSVTNHLLVPTALKNLRTGLMLADFYPQDGNRPTESIRTTGLINAIVGSGFAEVQNDTLQLTDLGRAWLAEPTPERFREGFWTWVRSADYDEINRINRLKDGYDLTPPAHRRSPIVAALSRVPLDKWVSPRDFFRAMKNWGLNFKVENSKFSVMRATGIGMLNQLSPNVYSSLVQGRYLLVTLMEMLPAFGAVELAFTDPEISNFPPDWSDLYYPINAAFSRYDGLQFFRLTSLGAYLLGLQPMYKPNLSTERMPIIQMHPDLKIQVLEESMFTLADKAAFQRCCVNLGNGWYRLDAQKMIKAIEEGIKPGDFLAFVEQKAAQALPEDFRAAVERWKERCDVLVRGQQAVLYQVKNLELMKELLQDEILRDRCWLVEEHQLAVPLSYQNDFIHRLHELEAGLKG